MTATALTKAPQQTLSRRQSVFADIGHVWLRETLTLLRDPFSLIFSLIQPLVFLGLFGPLLSGVAGAELGGGSLQWFLPGVVVMISLFGTSMVGSNLLYELMTGSFERVLATPLTRSSLMIGRALKEMTPLVVQALIIVLVAWPFGFEIYPLHIAIGLLLLGVFGIGLGALSYALALATRSSEWLFWGVQQTLLFPLLILSGMMLPLEAGPRWMQIVAQFNPLTYIVNAERELFNGQFGIATLAGAVAAVATCVIGLVVGVRVVRRVAL